MWDLARDHGIQGARSLAATFKTLTSPIFDVRSCPHCNTLIARESIFGKHIFSAHLSRSLADVISLLEEGDQEIFHIGSELKTLYSYTSVISDITYLPCSTSLPFSVVCSSLAGLRDGVFIDTNCHAHSFHIPRGKIACNCAVHFACTTSICPVLCPSLPPVPNS